MTLEQENAELKAHINSLREALEHFKEVVVCMNNEDSFKSEIKDVGYYARNALQQTPTQSLAEHDKKVIAEFRKDMSRTSRMNYKSLKEK